MPKVEKFYLPCRPHLDTKLLKQWTIFINIIHNMEEWKSVPYFSLYQCSKSGEIKNIKTGKILKPFKTLDGYLRPCLINDEGKPKSISVHKIIATTWIPNPESKPTVNHINKIRDDNRVINLEWATQKEQAEHKVKFNKDNNIRINTNSGRPIWKCDLVTKEKIQLYDSLTSASKDVNGVIDKISKAARNILPYACGFYWIYDDLSKKDKPDEKWKLYKKIKKNIYFISNCGNVKNKNRQLKTNRKNEDGYRHITIDNKIHLVHVIVARKFIPNPENLPIVNHKDGNKSNNHVDNLEWFTHQLNAQHAIDTGLRSDIKKVVHYDENNNILGIYTSCTSAGEALNICGKVIHDYCTNKVKQCHGMKLKVKYLAETDDIVNKKIDPETIPEIDGVNLKKVKIVHYDDKHNILNVFDSIDEASKKLKLAKTTVGNCCSGRIKKFHKRNINLKYLAETDDIENKKIDSKTIPEYDKTDKRQTQIIQYDEKYKIINIFQSVTEASQKLDISLSSVKNCCKGKIKVCKDNIRLKRMAPTDDIVNKKIDNKTLPYVCNITTFKTNHRDSKISIYEKETNEFVETLDNMVKVSEKYNLSVKSLYKHCDGSVKHSKCKYLFKYHEETS